MYKHEKFSLEGLSKEEVIQYVATTKKRIRRLEILQEAMVWNGFSERWNFDGYTPAPDDEPGIYIESSIFATLSPDEKDEAEGLILPVLVCLETGMRVQTQIQTEILSVAVVVLMRLPIPAGQKNLYSFATIMYNQYTRETLEKIIVGETYSKEDFTSAYDRILYVFAKAFHFDGNPTNFLPDDVPISVPDSNELYMGCLSTMELYDLPDDPEFFRDCICSFVIYLYDCDGSITTALAYKIVQQVFGTPKEDKYMLDVCKVLLQPSWFCRWTKENTELLGDMLQKCICFLTAKAKQEPEKYSYITGKFIEQVATDYTDFFLKDIPSSLTMLGEPPCPEGRGF